MLLDVVFDFVLPLVLVVHEPCSGSAITHTASQISQAQCALQESPAFSRAMDAAQAAASQSQAYAALAALDKALELAVTPDETCSALLLQAQQLAAVNSVSEAPIAAAERCWR